MEAKTHLSIPPSPPPRATSSRFSPHLSFLSNAPRLQKPQPGQRQRGCFQLIEGATVVELPPLSDTRHRFEDKFPFLVRTPERTLYMYALSSAQRRQWIRALKAHARSHQLVARDRLDPRSSTYHKLRDLITQTNVTLAQTLHETLGKAAAGATGIVALPAAASTSAAPK